MDIMKMNHLKAYKTLFFALGALVLLHCSCKKSPNTIGNDLIDKNNYINVYHTDTAVIEAYAFLDTVSTKNLSNALLGSQSDPVFGTTEAGFYTQLRISSVDHRFGQDPVFDSLVFQLYYGGYYGDTTTMQTLHVYELADTLSTTASYYNYSEVPVKTVDHANGFQFKPRPLTKSNIVGSDTIAKPILRIPLSAELGNLLINLDSTAYSEPDLFKASFPGLYLTCDAVNDGGAISYINLKNNTYTILQLYYHQASEPSKPLRFDYYVTNSDVFFCRYTHDYSQGDAAFQAQVVDGDHTLGQQRLYMQTMGGVKCFVKFPNFTKWGQELDGQDVVINEAKLIIPADSLYEDTLIFTRPSQLALLGINADGTTYLLPDYKEGSAFYGGTYSSQHKGIMFRISRYMQEMIKGAKPNCGIYMTINGASYNACRWVMAGPEAPQENKMRLEVTYSIVGE